MGIALLGHEIGLCMLRVKGFGKYTVVAAIFVIVSLILWKNLQSTPEARDPFHKHSGAIMSGDGPYIELMLPTKSQTRRDRPESNVMMRNLFNMHFATRNSAGKLLMDEVHALQAWLDAMDTELILDILDELDASRASAEDRFAVASWIFGSLSRRDYELAFDTFMPRLADPTVATRQYEVIFGFWTRADPEKTADWFRGWRELQNSHEPRGIIETHSDLIDEMDSLIFRGLLSHGSESARHYWADMHEDQRTRILNDDWFSTLSARKTPHTWEMLRELTDGDANQLATSASMRLRMGDLESVQRFIDLVDPSELEHAALVVEALRVRMEPGRPPRVTSDEAMSMLGQIEDDGIREEAIIRLGLW